METSDFIAQSLAQVQLRLLATCAGLSDEQARWRPAASANCIGFILWHVARVEDDLISAEWARDPLWTADGWHARMDLPAATPAPGDRQALRALPIPRLDLVRAYGAAAHDRARAFLDTLAAQELDRPSRIWADRPLATVLRHLITHKNNHHGQVDLLRGLQDPSWDLPAGTGMVLDRASE